MRFLSSLLRSICCCFKTPDDLTTEDLDELFGIPENVINLESNQD